MRHENWNKTADYFGCPPPIPLSPHVWVGRGGNAFKLNMAEMENVIVYHSIKIVISFDSTSLFVLVCAEKLNNTFMCGVRRIYAIWYRWWNVCVCVCSTVYARVVRAERRLFSWFAFIICSCLSAFLIKTIHTIGVIHAEWVCVNRMMERSRGCK